MGLSYKNRKYVWVAIILSSELAVSYANVLLRIAELRLNNPDDMTAAVLGRLSYTCQYKEQAVSIFCWDSFVLQ